jgi:TfoX/Sxy family transcriptional regulator of competence genes
MPSNDSWRKPSPEMVARFHEAVAGIDGVEVRKMFGMPAAFLNGNMVAGLHQDTTMVRLPENLRAERFADGWSAFEPMPGRPMREYVAMPPDVAGDVDATRGWLERAAAYVRTLPPKASRPARKRQAR